MLFHFLKTQATNVVQCCKHCLRFFSDSVQCPATVSSVSHATPSPVTDRTVDAEVTYTCEAGYFFDHTTLDNTATVKCLPTGDWSQLQGECTSSKQATYHIHVALLSAYTQ